MSLNYQKTMTSEMNRKIFELTLAVYRVTDLFPESEVLKRQVREKANEIMSSVLEHGTAYKKAEAISSVLAKIQAVRSLLSIARFSSMVKPVNIMVLDREYSFFSNFFEREFNYAVEEANGLINEAKIEQKAPIAIKPLLNTPHVVRQVRTERKSAIQIKKDAKRSTNIVEIGHEPIREEEMQESDRNGIEKRISASEFFNDRQKTILDHIRSNQQVRSTDLTGIFANRFSIKTLQRDLASLISQNAIEKEGDKRWAVYRIKI